ncbi:threonine/homoserine/homoserine lactone efflux protein [Actinomycetospora cinnamomea]|uniref:Threonine/homoserine/homoserine lactone efflux protein n=1 Tax=Actinomycetospora cinnamomea TaxID=663609 RepID=A0A2U1FDA8_9PSEU|nr:threonine/homoserine/homoserine lactone efflux protein [Actinomycetospora cinnamomea]
MHSFSWPTYGAFAAFALLLVIAPGPDFAVVVKNALVGGRRYGRWTSVGVTASNAVQGTAAALGVGALIVASQPLFEAVRWAGVVYLCWLGVQALRSAWRGPAAVPEDGEPVGDVASRWVRWRQGFLSNITNPKVLVFYLSVLPQFLQPGSSVVHGLALAYTHAAMSLAWLFLLVATLHTLRAWLARRRVRRSLDTLTGVALFGFAGRLATDSH